MGNNPGRLDAKSIAHLKKDTHLDKAQIKHLYKHFCDMAKAHSDDHWTISKEEFYLGLQDAGIYEPEGKGSGKLHKDDWKFIESFFDALDQKSQGKIDFKEFVTGIAVFATGNLQQSVDIIFEMYNLAGDDAITKDEMVEAVQAMGKVVNLDHFVKSAKEEGPDWKLQTKEWVEEVFAEADVSKTGTLNKKEFQEALQKHPVLRELASLFVNEVCKDFFDIDG